MIGVVGDHKDTWTRLHLGQFLSKADNLQCGRLSWLYLLFAEGDLQTTRIHLHRRDNECRGTSVRKFHIDSFLVLATKVGKVEISLRDLQLWGLGTTHTLKLTEVW